MSLCSFMLSGIQFNYFVMVISVIVTNCVFIITQGAQLYFFRSVGHVESFYVQCQRHILSGDW